MSNLRHIARRIAGDVITFPESGPGSAFLNSYIFSTIVGDQDKLLVRLNETEWAIVSKQDIRRHLHLIMTQSGLEDAGIKPMSYDQTVKTITNLRESGFFKGARILMYDPDLEIGKATNYDVLQVVDGGMVDVTPIKDMGVIPRGAKSSLELLNLKIPEKAIVYLAKHPSKAEKMLAIVPTSLLKKGVDVKTIIDNGRVFTTGYVSYGNHIVELSNLKREDPILVYDPKMDVRDQWQTVIPAGIVGERHFYTIDPLTNYSDQNIRFKSFIGY